MLEHLQMQQLEVLVEARMVERVGEDEPLLVFLVNTLVLLVQRTMLLDVPEAAVDRHLRRLLTQIHLQQVVRLRMVTLP